MQDLFNSAQRVNDWFITLYVHFAVTDQSSTSQCREKEKLWCFYTSRQTGQ